MIEMDVPDNEAAVQSPLSKKGDQKRWLFSPGDDFKEFSKKGLKGYYSHEDWIFSTYLCAIYCGTALFFDGSGREINSDTEK
jgi:hypothetical protein